MACPSINDQKKANSMASLEDFLSYKTLTSHFLNLLNVLCIQYSFWLFAFKQFLCVWISVSVSTCIVHSYSLIPFCCLVCFCFVLIFFYYYSLDTCLFYNERNKWVELNGREGARHLWGEGNYSQYIV